MRRGGSSQGGYRLPKPYIMAVIDSLYNQIPCKSQIQVPVIVFCSAVFDLVQMGIHPNLRYYSKPSRPIWVHPDRGRALLLLVIHSWCSVLHGKSSMCPLNVYGGRCFLGGALFKVDVLLLIHRWTVHAGEDSNPSAQLLVATTPTLKRCTCASSFGHCSFLNSLLFIIILVDTESYQGKLYRPNWWISGKKSAEGGWGWGSFPIL